MHMLRKFYLLCFTLFLAGFFSLVGRSSSFSSVEPFPQYPSIKNGIEFWKKVYTKFPSTKGYVHDSNDVSIIYAVVDLVDSEKPGAWEENRIIIKNAKEKYKAILLKLADGEQPRTQEERDVLTLWGPRAGPEKLKAAAENVRFQHCIRERFQEGLERSGRHLEKIQEIFRQKGLPAELAYLPHVESSFDYKAYSKVGASGIWQFIPDTGRRYLTIDYTVDERRDPIISTYAAASYLKENYEKLGSWPLALTAYNHGDNGMLKAKNQHGDFEEILKKYDSRSFGFASRNFYAQFLAALEVARNYEKYFAGVRIEPPLQARTVKIQGYLAVDDLVNHFGISPDVLRSLNPALREPVFLGQKYIPQGYEIRFPMLNNFDEKVAAIPPQAIKKEQKRSKFYKVARGDTAGRIAGNHQVSLRSLIEINNLDKSARIFVGQNLIIPPPAGKEVKTASVTPQSAKKKTGLSSSEKGKNDVLNADVKVIVQKAEKKERKVDAAVASVDQKKKKTAPDRSGDEAATEMGPSDIMREEVLLGDFQVEKIEGNGKVGLLRVEALETLGRYAEWLEVQTSEISRLNKMSAGQSIKTRQQIKIPLTKVSKELFEERRYLFHKGIEEDFYAVFKVVETQKYTVKKGDTIWTICNVELELPFWLIKKYNSMVPFDDLRPDQVLIVPVVEKIG